MLSVKGFAGTRLTDVAEYAELQAPAIYYYFPSREDLIEEVMYCGISDMQRDLQDTLDGLSADATAGQHHRRGRSAPAARTRTIRLHNGLDPQFRTDSRAPATRQKKEEAAYGRIWQTLFADAIANGDIRTDIDPRFARMLVIGALNWAAEWWDPGETPWTPSWRPPRN